MLQRRPSAASMKSERPSWWPKHAMLPGWHCAARLHKRRPSLHRRGPKNWLRQRLKLRLWIKASLQLLLLLLWGMCLIRHC